MAGLDDEVVDQALSKPAEQRVRVLLRHANQQVRQVPTVEFARQVEGGARPVVRVQDIQSLGIEDQDAGTRFVQDKPIVRHPTR